MTYANTTEEEHQVLVKEKSSSLSIPNNLINLKKQTEINQAKTLGDIEKDCLQHMFNNGFNGAKLPLDFSGERVDFAGRLGIKEKTEWYLGSQNENGNIIITYNSHHDTLKRDKNYVYRCKNDQLIDKKGAQERRKYVQNLESQRNLEKEKKRQEKAIKNRERFNKASENGSSLYLKRKQVGNYGIRFEQQGKDTIVLIPMRDESGNIQALQEIYETKRQFKGPTKPRDKNFTNEVKGLFHVIGNILDGQLIRISEGYSTAASCYESTGCKIPHVVSFSAVAYTTVVPIIRRLYPNSSLVICADNNIRDDPTKENTGIKEAEKTTREIQKCSFVFPIFKNGKDKDKEGKYYADFNDLMLVEGKDEVKRQLEFITISDEKFSKDKKTQLSLEKIETPDGYVLNHNGVWKETTLKNKKTSDIDEKSNTEEKETILIKICNPIWVVGRSRDYSGSNSGLIIKWIDMDGIIRETCIERRKLHTPGNSIAEELAHNSLVIIPGKEMELKKYLSGFIPNKTYRAVKSLGWLENPLGDLLYISKNKTFSDQVTNLKEEIIFQPENISLGPFPLECMGTLEEWKENIAIPCRGNSIPIFLQSYALSGTIIKYADTGSNGIHLSGFTSKGKTTAAQVAASTTGCAADPSYAPKLSIIKRWLATANALESLASQSTDGVLILDEIGQCPGSDLDKVIYNLFGGRGKERLNQQSQQKTTRDWCTTVISTGEKTLQERLSETNSKTPAGLFVRFIDLHVEEVFTNYHGENSKTFVDKLKRDCGQFYGIAAFTFIQKVINKYKNSQELRESISKGCASVANEISHGTILNQEHARVLKLFCFTALTGLWAVEWGIFPYTREEILNSVQDLFLKWHADNQKQTEDVQCICAVRDYYLKKRDSAFRDCELPIQEIKRYSDIYGYTTRLKKFYLTKEGLSQALGGLTKKIALKALFDKGYLLKEESSKRSDSKKTISGIGAPRVFVISETICEFDGETA